MSVFWVLEKSLNHHGAIVVCGGKSGIKFPFFGKGRIFRDLGIEADFVQKRNSSVNLPGSGSVERVYEKKIVLFPFG